MEPIHQPCPDLPAYSLNAEQKKTGLEKLQQVRKNLGAKMLADLRSEYPTASKAKQSKIQERARHIEQVWC